MANRRATNIGAARVEVGSWLVALSSDEGLRRAVQVANTAHLSWMTGDLWYHARILLFLDKFTLPLEQMDLASASEKQPASDLLGSRHKVPSRASIADMPPAHYRRSSCELICTQVFTESDRPRAAHSISELSYR